MMEAVVYWLPLASFIGTCGACVVDLRLKARIAAMLASERETLAAVDTSIAVLAQRNRDFAEALELLEYGAHDEAIELLRNWGEVKIGSPS